MSDRCSFTSEYIYNWNDYKRLKDVFSGHQTKYLCVAPPAEWSNGEETFEMPIIQGKAYGSGAGDEWEILDNMLDGLVTEDRVRFVILTDTPKEGRTAMYVLDKRPDGIVEKRNILESYVLLDNFDKYRLEEQNY